MTNYSVAMFYFTFRKSPQRFISSSITDISRVSSKILLVYARLLSSEFVLYFENIVGIIQICGTMYLIALIVFLLEVMTAN